MRYLLLLPFFMTMPVLAEEKAKSNFVPEGWTPLTELDDTSRYVMEHDGTEPAFDNEYWDHKEEAAEAFEVARKAYRKIIAESHDDR